MPPDSTDLLVVTGAGGKQASRLLPLLIPLWPRLRLITNSSASSSRLASSYPSAEVIIADLVKPSTCLTVLAGATSIYHVGPSFHSLETAIGLNMVSAAVHTQNRVIASGEGKRLHFVYSSVLNSQLSKLFSHVSKRQIEEALIESGLDYTILAPTHLMDHFPVKTLNGMKGNEVYFSSFWNSEAEFSFVALQDLAEAAMTVLQERHEHTFSKYDICGTMPLSYHKVCEVVGKVIGKTIVAKQQPLKEADTFPETIFGDKTDQGRRDEVEGLMSYYNKRGLKGNPNVLEWLIARAPTTYEKWAEIETAIPTVEATQERTYESTADASDSMSTDL